MRVAELYGRGKPVFSFEFFLPKTPEGMDAFRATVAELRRLHPEFVTLTYGAGGSARGKTLETAGWLQRETGLPTVAHLTCIAHTKAEIREILGQLKSLGIENIMALRGDAPKDAVLPPLEKRDYRYAVDLIRDIKAHGGFGMGVAGYPEKHPEALSLDADLQNVVAKLKAGGDFVTTQLFFDNDVYFAFADKLRAQGVTQPIVPGLMPVTNYGQLVRFASMCGCAIPARMAADLEALQHDSEAVLRYGIEWTYAQAQDLLKRGAPGLHFYTLNRSHSTFEVLSRLQGRDSLKA